MFEVSSVVVFAVVVGLLAGGGSAWADFTFGEPVNLGPTINSPSGEGAPTIFADGLSLFFTSLRGGGSGGADLWVSTRVTIEDDWSIPQNLVLYYSYFDEYFLVFLPMR